MKERVYDALLEAEDGQADHWQTAVEVAIALEAERIDVEIALALLVAEKRVRARQLSRDAPTRADYAGAPSVFEYRTKGPRHDRRTVDALAIPAGSECVFAVAVAGEPLPIGFRELGTQKERPSRLYERWRNNCAPQLQALHNAPPLVGDYVLSVQGFWQPAATSPPPSWRDDWPPAEPVPRHCYPTPHRIGAGVLELLTHSRIIASGLAVCSLQVETFWAPEGHQSCTRIRIWPWRTGRKMPNPWASIGRVWKGNAKRTAMRRRKRQT